MKIKLLNILKMIKFIAKINLVSVILCCILSLISAIMSPIILKLIYNLVLTVEDSSFYNDESKIFMVVGIIVLYVLASSILSITGVNNLILFEKMQIKVGVNLLRKMYEKIGKLPHVFFENNENAAKVERMILYSQDSAITQNIVHIISCFTNFIALFGFIFIFIDVSILFLILLVICAVLSNSLNFNEELNRWLCKKELNPSEKRIREINEYFSLKNIISEMRMLKTFNFTQEKWNEENNNVFKREYKYEKVLLRKALFYNLLKLIIKQSH